MTHLSRQDLIDLPKAELHIHLEAGMRPATAGEFADRYGLPVPSRGPYSGLKGFVTDYEAARNLLGSLDDVARVAYELVEDSSARGVVWMEVHCVPYNYGGRLGPAESVLEAVLEGLHQGANATGVGGGVILAHNRAANPTVAWETLGIAERYREQGVVALGLVGNEVDFPPAPYATLFATAKASGLRSVPHAGEGAGAGSVRSAWKMLAADRISHGVRAAEDRGLLKALADAGVCLDVCPTSNVMLQASSSIKAHQLPDLIDAGVRVSLASDGPLFFGVDIVDEYLHAHHDMHLDAYRLTTIARDSILASCAPDNVRAPALGSIQTWRDRHAPARRPQSSQA